MTSLSAAVCDVFWVGPDLVIDDLCIPADT